jgi:hypothetical protein
MRRMYDAVDIDNLPLDVALTLGYVDGRDTAGHYDRVRRARPQARVIAVTVTGATLDAVMGDVETGDMTPVSGAGWARRMLAAGRHPTLYMNASTWPAVRAEVQKAGVAGRVSYFVADYDGVAEIPPGAIGKQFTDRALGKTLDESVVAAHWPGVDADVAAAPVIVKVDQNRGYATLHWTRTPGATSYDVYEDGVLVAIHTAGHHTTGPRRQHGARTFRVLALGPDLRVWSKPVLVQFR